MNAVDRLAELVQPPADVAAVDWAAAERRFGLRFPGETVPRDYEPGELRAVFESLKT